MKVLATIPKQRGRPSYIVELHADEVSSVSMMTSTYGKLPVTDAEGNPAERDHDKLQVGDVIDPEFVLRHMANFATYVAARSSIEDAMATLRAAMTKLENMTATSQV